MEDIQVVLKSTISKLESSDTCERSDNAMVVVVVVLVAQYESKHWKAMKNSMSALHPPDFFSLLSLQSILKLRFIVFLNHIYHCDCYLRNVMITLITFLPQVLFHDEGSGMDVFSILHNNSLFL